MSTDHAHVHHLENPDKSGPPPKIDVVGTVPGAPPAPEGAEAMTILVTLPPNSPGAPPHRHSGPAFGFVIKGAIDFAASPRGSSGPVRRSGSPAGT
jgi:quercetin dioxygenase-like cupin family protein